MTEWNAIVLAGGRARRLGGIDKTALVFDGATLLEHALAAAAGARSIVVVGANSAVVETPRFAGPAAATIAGLHALPPALYTAVLAADQPRVARALPLLLDALAGRSVIAVDEQGRRQPLLAVYDSAALARAAAEAGPLENLAMSALIGRIPLLEVRLPAGLCADVDTPDDARALGIAAELAHV